MSEWWRVVLVFCKLQVIIAFVMLYIIGGRQHKYLRRFVGGTLLVLSVILFAFIHKTLTWELALISPSIYLGLILGYGGEVFFEKFFRRLAYGFMFALPALAISFTIGRPLLGLFQVTLSVIASVYLGLLNPVEAVDEEAFIATLSSLCYPFLN